MRFVLNTQQVRGFTRPWVAGLYFVFTLRTREGREGIL